MPSWLVAKEGAQFSFFMQGCLSHPADGSMISVKSLLILQAPNTCNVLLRGNKHQGQPPVKAEFCGTETRNPQFDQNKKRRRVCKTHI